jgi:CRISPR/Cas system CSM-associated protein Csm3 (group 7 of RAMP superfamily)
MSQNLVEERFYITGNLEVVSPLIIGSGEDDRTDIDLIRDGSGQPFIPGTSIAGVLRHHLDETIEKNKTNPIVLTLLGEKEKESIQSLLMISDALPGKDTDMNVSVRDGIKLDYQTKTVAKHDVKSVKKSGAKYDYEVIEPGASFGLRMELLIRENNKQNDEIEKIYDCLALIIEALEQGDMQMGAKTARGFGKLQLKNTKLLKLDMNNKTDAERWIDFDWDNWKFESNFSYFQLKKNILKKQEKEKNEISAYFSIPYSLIVRHYSENPDDDDTVHLTSNGKLVIPGTSWNGAIRHAIYHVMGELLPDLDNALTSQKIDNISGKIIDDMFGYVKTGKKKALARASRVSIGESSVNGGTLISCTRNKVDRFTGGVVDSALFSEKPVYGGTVTLNISIKKPAEANKEKAEIGLLFLALKDIGSGIQPLGGDANIGRGILKLEKPGGMTINGASYKDRERQYLPELLKYLETLIKEFKGEIHE